MTRRIGYTIIVWLILKLKVIVQASDPMDPESSLRYNECTASAQKYTLSDGSFLGNLWYWRRSLPKRQTVFKIWFSLNYGQLVQSVIY